MLFGQGGTAGSYSGLHCHRSQANLSDVLRSRECFCEQDFHAPLRASLPHVELQPVVLLGPIPYLKGKGKLFGEAFVAEAQRYGYTGYYLAQEYKGSGRQDKEYALFCEHAKAVLNKANLTLTVLWRTTHQRPMDILNATVDGIQVHCVFMSGRSL